MLEDMAWDAWVGVRDVLRGADIENPSGVAEEAKEFMKLYLDEYEKMAL